ncbi:MAG TPA: ATPase domain-containing protein, partial [Polyangiaceae bacterium]
MNKTDIIRVATGVPNVDALLCGGLPKGSISVLAGPPGAGKTTLAHQFCFHNGTAKHPALYFSTLSEPTAKTLRYSSQFAFFDAAKVETAVQFVDLGVLLRGEGLEATAKLLMAHVRRVKPALVVIDSFKVFDDLAHSREALRKFSYELAVNLMAWDATALLLGEYGPKTITENPLFSVIDGIFFITQREQSGEQQRFLQIVKMRGTAHSREEHPFVITSAGIDVFAPSVMLPPEARGKADLRCKTWIPRLDELLGEGIPRGSSLLVAGAAGTGKTVLLLEFIYRGAQAGEKGILFAFEETDERLRAAARGLGWDIDREIERGMISIVCIPQPNTISVEEHLVMIGQAIADHKIRRVVIDSVSVFLYKVRDPQISRQKMFQLANLIRNSRAVALLATDIPYGSNQISRFGVEETVVDGVILVTSKEEGFERQRYIEIYKLRNTAHLKGRHNMVIARGGIQISPRYGLEAELLPPAVEPTTRLSSGVPGLDELLNGGLLRRSVTLLSGPAGSGKSTIGLQFIAEGARLKQPGLFVALEEAPAQLLTTAAELGIPLKKSVKSGLVDMVYLGREQVRANQLFAILADKIQKSGTRRLVLDSVSRILTEGLAPDEARQLLHGLVARFKTMGVTSVFTLEVIAMHGYEGGASAGASLSQLVDNVVLLRYTPAKIALAEEVAHRLALALDNARLHRVVERAVQDRQEILGIVSHDLRSPLSAILLSTEVLLEGPAPNEVGWESRKTLEIVTRAAKRMEYMISDLVDSLNGLAPTPPPENENAGIG